MALNSTIAVQSIQSLYLNENGADVWFIFGDQRVPAHKHILSAICPYYNTMFYGSLPEGGEVDLSITDITAEIFKEFLKFCYMLEPNLNMDNMNGVMRMAKQSSSNEIFAVCEKFMTKSITADSMFYGYQLALLHGSNSLREFCEWEICVNAEKLLKSFCFVSLPHEYLLAILKCDSLACEEIHIFDACVGWARAACRRNGTNPSNAADLKYQLGDAIYEIRFTSMTKEALATCLNRCPGLFSVDDLQEIISMVAQKTEYKPKHFNWTPRYFNLRCNKDNELCGSRVSSNGERYLAEGRVDVTEFTSNRRAILTGFTCDNDARCRMPVRVVIYELNSSGDLVERYNERSSADFVHTNQMRLDSYQAYIKLKKVILIRPKYSYEIHVCFDTVNGSDAIQTYRIFKKKVRIDHDIVLRFKRNRGIVASINIRRFDNRNFIQKIIQHPTILLRPIDLFFSFIWRMISSCFNYIDFRTVSIYVSIAGVVAILIYASIYYLYAQILLGLFVLCCIGIAQSNGQD